MKTVDKALSVLDQFSLENTELGLSELSRMAALDKAATRRLLVALSKHGFIEQSTDSRKYRLGNGFLRLARIREATVPITQAAQEVADWLVDQTQETAHVSIPGTQGMTTIAHRLPNRGHVVNIVPSQLLYYHATASGLAYLAFASKKTVDAILTLKRERVTRSTVISKSELLKLITRFKSQGFSQTLGTFESEVSCIGMPFFQDSEDPAGSIALALPQSNLTEERRDELLPLLSEAVSRLETALTGL